MPPELNFPHWTRDSYEHLRIYVEKRITVFVFNLNSVYLSIPCFSKFLQPFVFFIAILDNRNLINERTDFELHGSQV